MASEPYLMSRKAGCFKGTLPDKLVEPRLPRHDPNCVVDKYPHYFRSRWNILRQDVCDRCPPKPLCNIKALPGECGNPNLYGPHKHQLTPTNVQRCSDICIDPYALYDKKSHEKTVYDYPWSHNNVDDCCKSECPCKDDKASKVPCGHLKIEREAPTEPLDSCTTYRYYHNAKPTPCPAPRHRPDPYDPCECPLESATQYRLDYEPKKCVPQGIAPANLMKGGLWSADQLNKCFRDDTENKFEFVPKCGRRRQPYLPKSTLKPEAGRYDGSSETCAEYGRKCFEEKAPYPHWIHNDTWLPPETALERCTTYNHFYKPYKIRAYPGYPAIQSPDAIPFSSLNNMWYTCCDPPVDQRIPVEMKDDDPWPRVMAKPMKYQDNLQPDPCASFKDETTYKADYWAKKRCAPNKWYGPSTGYTPPMLPFNDNTTNRASYIAYPPDAIRNATQSAGNPDGIKWGPYKCRPEEDKCMPRFPPPYGHPIKPYTRRCPCGQFDDRSTYHHDFKFWTQEMADQVIEEQSRDINVPKGLSLYRRDFDFNGGKKAEIMPPPVSKGSRCVRPCPYHDLDSLYSLTYRDFWKELPYERVDTYRGHPTMGKKPKVCKKEPEPITVYQMPPGTTVQETLKILEKEKQAQCC